MSKELSEMSLEELWQLFPIFLVAPNEKWEQEYQEIEKQIKEVLKELSVVRISHVGSTSIKGIWAKDIVDVLVEIAKDQDLQTVLTLMEQNGFTAMWTDERHISFNKGYTKDGFADKVYHVHVRYSGDNDELYFRDYLNEHPEIAKEYEMMKLELWKKYEHDRDAYTEAKSDFIKKWTKEARKAYGDRYI
ncbi:GrpB family protein [Butyrivibrio sp. X503]|uniref:GrpB family protein n=1 Tax=Butyrivibrio sp. X503 TaxID=2364878 RepID=UPI000EA97486|nr:GrpB family protein [Butyrivibrio sp. X503]RKM55927.1 GrpB family protein [Butyrivibrio sp. X503]